MPIYDTFSKRKKRSQNDAPDVYQYDIIPDRLRTQIRYIWDDAIGSYHTDRSYGFNREQPNNNRAWEYLRDIMRRELGVATLSDGAEDAKDECCRFLLEHRDTDQVLDIIELTFLYIKNGMSEINTNMLKKYGAKYSHQDAVEELNARFLEAGVGYQFSNNIIIRMDSEFIHSEIVLPALNLLTDNRFSGPRNEFLAAHAHYRAGENKDAVADAFHAFESTMKTICDIKGWSYNNGARAGDLVKILRKEDLLPDYMGKSFDQLIATLSSGLPKVRNEEGGHGQGAKPRETPSYVTAYAIHLAAAKIVFLVEALNDSE